MNNCDLYNISQNEKLQGSLQCSDLYKLNKDELILLISHIQDMKEKEVTDKFNIILKQLSLFLYKNYDFMISCKKCDSFHLIILIGGKEIEHQCGSTKKEEYRSCAYCRENYCKYHTDFLNKYCNTCGKRTERDICDKCWISPICDKCSDEERDKIFKNWEEEEIDL